MARQWVTSDGEVVNEDGTDAYVLPDGAAFFEDQAEAAGGGSLVLLRRHNYPNMNRLLAR